MCLAKTICRGKKEGKSLENCFPAQPCAAHRVVMHHNYAMSNIDFFVHPSSSVTILKYPSEKYRCTAIRNGHSRRRLLHTAFYNCVIFSQTHPAGRTVTNHSGHTITFHRNSQYHPFIFSRLISLNLQPYPCYKYRSVWCQSASTVTSFFTQSHVPRTTTFLLLKKTENKNTNSAS